MADSIIAPGGADVRISTLGTDTAFQNIVGVVAGGVDRTLSTTPGAVADLGTLPAGTALAFWIRPDGLAQRLGEEQFRITQTGPDTWLVAGEDLTANPAANPRGFSESPLDFNDIRLQVELVRGTGAATGADWNARADDVTANHAASGQWFGTPGYAPTQPVPVAPTPWTDWNTLAAAVTANHAATGEWFA